MKKISLKGISEILSEKELKNVMGGSSSSGCGSGCTVGKSCTQEGTGRSGNFMMTGSTCWCAQYK